MNSIIISNGHTQIVYFPTHIPDCDSYSPALLDLFVFSEASICSAITFPQLENSDHVAASISMDFPLNSKQDDPYHCIDYGYCRADWDGLRDNDEMLHERISLNSVLLLLLVNLVSGFRLELVSLISMVFSCLCCFHSV